MLGDTIKSLNSTSQPAFISQAVSPGLISRNIERASNNFDNMINHSQTAIKPLAKMLTARQGKSVPRIRPDSRNAVFST